MKTKAVAETSEGAPAPSVPQKPEDPLALAKKKFDEALAKTKAEDGGEAPETEEVKVEVVPHKKPKAEKPKAEPKKDDAALTARIADLERRLEEASKPKAAPEPEVDPLKAIQERLAEKFGEEEGATLAETFGALVKPLLDKTAAMEKLIVEATKRGQEQTAKANRSRIGKEHAHLKESDAAWEMVTNQVRSLIEREPNKFSTLDEAFDHVVEALYGGQEEAEEEESDEGDAEAIAASAPTIPSHKTAERKLTPLQKSKMVFDVLAKDPENLAGAKRTARELRIG